MNERDWKGLLAELEIVPPRAEVVPVKPAALNAYEKKRGVRLPASYRTYCRVFGPGQLAGEFNIAVPGFAGEPETQSVEYLSQSQHELAEQYAKLGVDLAQCKRGIFFASDLIGSIHFLDPEDVTDAKKPEYAVYTLFRDCEVQRSADSFAQFVMECCLGSRHSDLIADGEPVERVFRPSKMTES